MTITLVKGHIQLLTYESVTCINFHLVAVFDLERFGLSSHKLSILSMDKDHDHTLYFIALINNYF